MDLREKRLRRSIKKENRGDRYKEKGEKYKLLFIQIVVCSEINNIFALFKKKKKSFSLSLKIFYNSFLFGKRFPVGSG